MAKPTAPIVILLVQGNRRTGESVEPVLRKQGYEVVRAATGRDAINRVKGQRPAVVVFDNSSWRGSCVRVCSELCDANVPILVLLAEQQVRPDGLSEQITTLKRPFTTRKLTNCIKQLIPIPDGEVLQIGNVRFNVQQRHVRKGREDYHLTPMQAQLLEVFMRHPGETLSRRYLIKQVWGWSTDDVNDTRTLDVHVRWLREIVEDRPSAPELLATVRGVGYRFGPQEKTS